MHRCYGDGMPQPPADFPAQVEADSGGPLVQPPVAAGETPVKNPRQVLRRDAHTVVLDEKPLPFAPDLHMPTEERAEYLVGRYADLLLRIGKTWLGDMDDAKDICQTALIKLLEHPGEFPDEGQERAWVVRVAVNECKNWRKTAWFRHRVQMGAHQRRGPPQQGGDLPHLVPLVVPQEDYLPVYVRQGLNQLQQSPLLRLLRRQLQPFVQRGPVPEPGGFPPVLTLVYRHPYHPGRRSWTR